jgi:Ca-activated chloride channel family protein
LSDAGTRANNAAVTAEVFHIAADALGAPMKPTQSLTLTSNRPRRIQRPLPPDEAGVYLIRARSGAEMVSAGLVHNPSSEASLGTVNETLLREAAKLTGGEFLADPGRVPDLETTKAIQHEELWPPLLVLLLMIFLIDTGIRRWEHVVGLWQLVPSQARAVLKTQARTVLKDI